MRKSNVIFCKSREGIPKIEMKLIKLETPKDIVEQIDLIGFGYDGARTASVKCGKGWIAKFLNLNYLIDDR